MSNAQSPEDIREYSEEAVKYVASALGVEITYDSETLPVLDHYLRSVSSEKPQIHSLIAITSGCYFGETLRALLGGQWEQTDANDVRMPPTDWKVRLTCGITVHPAALVLSTILSSDEIEPSPSYEVADPIKEIVEESLKSMGDVSEESYFSLSGRLDTLEHLHHVIFAEAARRQKIADDAENSQAN